MSQPNTREDLKQYCLRNLGKPVIEINVDDDQLEDRLDEGLQYFQEYHFDAVEKIYHRHRITGSTVSIENLNGTFEENETIEGTTSGATATVFSSNTSSIVFKNHKDSNNISNNSISSTFTNNEIITGKKSGATATTPTTGDIVVFGDVDNKYIPLSDAIIGVIRIFDIQDTGGAQTSSSMFSFRYQFHLNELPYLTTTSIINYSMSMQHIQLLNDMFVGKIPIRFNRHQDRLYLDLDWASDIKIDEYIVVEAFRIIDPSLYGQVYNDMFLKKYVTALFKKQWGSNLIKYQGVSLPGGITLDGRQLFDDAVNELREIEEQFQSRFQLPIDFMVGPG